MGYGRDTRAPDAVVWEADDRVFEGLGYGVRLVERLEARGLRVRREDLTSHHDSVAAAQASVDRLESAWSRRTFDRIVDHVPVDGR